MPKDAFDDLFDNQLDYRLLSLIYRKAVYQDEGVIIENVHVKRGQWIRSYRKLAEDLKYKEGRGYKQYSPPAILKAVKRLEEKGYIKISLVRLTDQLTGKLTDRLTLIEVVESQENKGVSSGQKTDQLTDRLTDELPDQATKVRTKEIKEKTYDQPSGRSSESYSDDFEKFWDIYPRKVGKKKAFSCWKARLKAGATKDELLTAVKNYSAHCKRENTEARFVKHPSTFLGPNLDYEDWIENQSEQQTSNVIHFKDKREKAVFDGRAFQVAVTRWTSAGREPTEAGFEEWLKEGAIADAIGKY